MMMNRAADPFGRLAGFGSVAARHDDNKFIAAITRNDVFLIHTAENQASDLHQCLSADQMAVTVIHALKSVQVEKNNAEAILRFPARIDHLGNALVDESVVVKLRQI